MNETHGGHLFTEEQLNLATDNYEAQEALVEGIRSAFTMSGMSSDELAAELALSVPEAEAWVNGDVDLHLSQLRHLANAVDAKVTYRVSALRTRYKRRLHVLEGVAVWKTTDWDIPSGRLASPGEILARHR